MKRSYSITLKVITVIAVIIGIVYANISRGKSEINGIEITIDYNDNDTLVTSPEINDLVLSKISSLMDMTIQDVDRNKIENVVRENPFVASVAVSVGIKGTIEIHIKQRIPIVRIYQGKQQFYLDNEGHYMPISSIRNQKVIVASGTIRGKKNDASWVNTTSEKNNTKSNSDIVRIYKLTKYLLSKEKLRSQFDQIYINRNGDIELIPKVGNHTVLIGDLNHLDEKFENLYAVYTEGFSNTGWDAYKKINLKYKNQVVCTKN